MQTNLLMQSFPKTPSEREAALFQLENRLELANSFVKEQLVRKNELEIERNNLVLALGAIASNLRNIIEAPVSMLSEYRLQKQCYNEMNAQLTSVEERCEQNFAMLEAAQLDILKITAALKKLKEQPIDNVVEFR
jgi:chromosome segregation ATPase